MYSIPQLNEKTVKQLRQIARELSCATGNERERANKAQLIDWIIEAQQNEVAKDLLTVIEKGELDTSGLIEGENKQDEQENKDDEECEQDASEPDLKQKVAEMKARKKELDKQFESAQEQEPEEPEAPEAPASTDPLAQAIAQAIQPYMEQKLDEDQVQELIEKNSSANGKIIIENKERVSVKIDRQHFKFELLLKVASTGVNPMLVGPAGTGKTHASKSLAEALQLSFDAFSVSPMTSKADLFGYKDANGNYHSTALVRQFTFGGVCLGDELDAGNAGALTGINMATANGMMATPEGMKERHDDFIFIACANTYGQGANRQYVGRNQLDSATLDRFAFIDWGYDESIEAMEAGLKKSAPKFDIMQGGEVTPEAWFERATKVRHAVDKLQVRHVVGRAVRNGIKLCQAGIGLDHLDSMLLWRGLSEDQVSMIKAESGV